MVEHPSQTEAIDGIQVGDVIDSIAMWKLPEMGEGNPYTEYWSTATVDTSVGKMVPYGVVGPLSIGKYWKLAAKQFTWGTLNPIVEIDRVSGAQFRYNIIINVDGVGRVTKISKVPVEHPAYGVAEEIGRVAEELESEKRRTGNDIRNFF